MRKIKLFFITAAGLLVFGGCQKIVHGYLSQQIFYQVNPLVVQQGITTATGSLITNGSTEPLYVKLLALRDATGKDARGELMTPQMITAFTGVVTYADSTLALLHAKLKDSMAAPFSIDSIGGRMQFTSATAGVPAGTYNMDIQVSNVRGTETLDNACQIVIQPLSSTYSIGYQRLEYFDATGVLQATYLNDNITEVEYASSDTTVVVFRFMDANGTLFDPAKGEVTNWLASRPTMKNWDPYYAPVVNDTAMIFRIPNTGLTFPYFQTCRNDDGSTNNGNGNFVAYYKVPNTANQGNQNIQSLTVMQLLAKGIYTVTVHYANAVHK